MEMSTTRVDGHHNPLELRNLQYYYLRDYRYTHQSITYTHRADSYVPSFVTYPICPKLGRAGESLHHTTYISHTILHDAKNIA